MHTIISIIEQHGLLVVFMNVVLAQSGLPLPVFPTLITAAALAPQSRYGIPELILAGLAGSLIADLAWFWNGRRYGRGILALLCKMSLSPDSCVRQTETGFMKLGPWSLLFAKLLPGLSIISVTMAGTTMLSLPVFLLFDVPGALLPIGAAVALGLTFQKTIVGVLSALAQIGEWSAVLVVGALALYLLGRWWRRQAFIRRLRMDRISVEELCDLMHQGQELVILDVRPREARLAGGIIPGALAAHPEDLDPVISSYSPEREIVVYCACPNEESAATAARHLKKAGFKKIRPLLGGVDAWVRAGHPLEGGSVPASAATPSTLHPERA
jgi:membrane protein DedA with SNARE-associated domain/rhodanese-related sulfurtransferase